MMHVLHPRTRLRTVQNAHHARLQPTGRVAVYRNPGGRNPGGRACRDPHPITSGASGWCPGRTTQDPRGPQARTMHVLHPTIRLRTAHNAHHARLRPTGEARPGGRACRDPRWSKLGGRACRDPDTRTAITSSSSGWVSAVRRRTPGTQARMMHRLHPRTPPPNGPKRTPCTIATRRRTIATRRRAARPLVRVVLPCSRCTNLRGSMTHRHD